MVQHNLKPYMDTYLSDGEQFIQHQQPTWRKKPHQSLKLKQTNRAEWCKTTWNTTWTLIHQMREMNKHTTQRISYSQCNHWPFIHVSLDSCGTHSVNKVHICNSCTELYRRPSAAYSPPTFRWLQEVGCRRQAALNKVAAMQTLTYVPKLPRKYGTVVLIISIFIISSFSSSYGNVVLITDPVIEILK